MLVSPFLDVFDNPSPLTSGGIASSTAPQTLQFPFKSLPDLDYRGGARFFGAQRDNGNRLHAGCDLIFPAGTAIYAMADGVVGRIQPIFYWGTSVLEIVHRDAGLIIRYGEIKPGSIPSEIAFVGAQVKAGQRIASVGQLIKPNGAYAGHMLHIEMYTNVDLDPVANHLTDQSAAGGKMQRRSDVVDPAPYLDRAAKVMPTGA